MEETKETIESIKKTMRHKNKKYIIVIEETDKGIHIQRENGGFNVFELLGFIESIKSEIVTQIQSMDKRKKTVKRTVNDEDGKYVINIES